MLVYAANACSTYVLPSPLVVLATNLARVILAVEQRQCRRDDEERLSEAENALPLSVV